MTSKQEKPYERSARIERQRNWQGKQKPVSTYHKVIYDNYKRHIDEAIDNAFQNIMWQGSAPDHLQQVSGNSVAFPIKQQFIVLVTIGLVETKSGVFGWKVIASMVVNKTKAIHKEPLWTRRHRQGIINVAKAFFEGCGKISYQMTYEIKDSILVGWKALSDEDMEVVDVAREQETQRLALTGQIEL